MLSVKKVITFIAIVAWICTLGGCNNSNKIPKMDAVVDSFSTPKQTLEAESNAAKYDQDVRADSSIDSAIELSQKYALLSEEVIKLKEKNKNISDENIKIKEKNNSLKTQLDQTKKELSEANDLLVEMRIELNNWKNDILGFRDEMRDAQKAQLEALFKVLTILGGQTNDITPQQTPQEESVQISAPKQQNIQPPKEESTQQQNKVEDTTEKENMIDNTTGQEND